MASVQFRSEVLSCNVIKVKGQLRVKLLRKLFDDVTAIQAILSGVATQGCTATSLPWYCLKSVTV